VERDLETIRALDLATSGYWIDRPYASGVNTFDFDPARYSDPAAMVARAHALGMRMALWHTPYVGEDEAPELHATARARGYFPPSVPIVFNRWGQPLDFSNPEATAWWEEQLAGYRALGIEGYKLDYGEDVIVGFDGGRLRWAFADGTDERTMHKRYADLYHRPYAAQLPEDGGFLLVRAGTWGDQQNGPVVWPGDLDADLSAFGDPRPEDPSVRGVGGLPSALHAAMGLGPSGYPFFAADTGGYRHSPPDKETFVRWAQQSALSVVMQTGNSASCMPWEFDEQNGWDEESLAIYRTYARLHLRLWPYLWSYATRLAEDGRAIVRPLGLVYPELGHPHDTYLLGDHLLVAPVIVHGARTRTHLLPEGRWVDWESGEVHVGPGEITVAAPLAKIPLYLREGGIVPLLREDADTLATASEPGVESARDRPGTLGFRIMGGPASRFPLHDGGELEQEDREGVLRLRWQPGRELTGDARAEILGRSGAPRAVRFDGRSVAAGEDWDWSGGLLRVRLPAGSAVAIED
jgi:alpha-D-xyloside xylohydrolase